MLKKIKTFFASGLWRAELRELPFFNRIGYRLMRFFSLTAKGYLRDNCLLHASALTYITMLAIVPVLALGLSMVRAFGGDELAQKQVTSYIDSFISDMEVNLEAADPASAPMAEPEEALEAVQTKREMTKAFTAEIRNIANTIFEQINGINFGKIGGIGAISLILMVIGVLGKIENSFNQVWGVARTRPLWRKFTDYLSIIIVVPVLLVAASSIPVLETVNKINPNAGQVVRFFAGVDILHRFVPLLMGTCLLAFLFGFLPNTRVKTSSCFVGGLTTAIILSVWFKLCLRLQVGIVGNSALYGSFVALPILLMWIHTSWQIILLGSEIAYVHQFGKELLRENAFVNPSGRDRIFIAIALCMEAARTVAETNKPLNAEAFSARIGISQRLLAEVIHTLVDRGVIVPVMMPDESTDAYMLCGCATHLKLATIFRAFIDDTPGEDIVNTAKLPPMLRPISERLDATLESAFNTTLAELAEQTQSALKPA